MKASFSSPVWQVHPSVAEGCQPQLPPAAGAATCRLLEFDASLALAKRTQLEMSARQESNQSL